MKDPRRSTIPALVLFALLVPATLTAQVSPTEDHLDPEFLTPQISVGLSGVPVRNFENLNGTVGTAGATISATVPVYQQSEGTPDNPTTYFVMARGLFAPAHEDVSLLPSLDVVYRSRVGLTGGILTTQHHLYLLTLGAGIAEEDKAIGDPRLRATGSLLGKYQLEESFAFIYGLSYSYTFDRGLLLPLLGVDCSLGGNFRLHTVLPFTMNVDYTENSDLRFAFVVRANGDRIHLDQNSYGGSQSLPLYLKMTQVQAGFDVSLRVGGSFWLKGEAGIVRDRRLAVGTTDKDLVSGNIENAGYSALTLSYRMAKFVSWGD